MEFLIAALLAAQPPRPIRPNEPPPAGQRIEAKDGDTIVVRGGARIRIIQRSEGLVRAIYDNEQHWLVLLVDYADPEKGAPDGAVDSTYRFDGVEGVWPLGERWEGSAVLDDYTVLSGPSGGLGFTASGAFVQLLSGSPVSNTRWYADSRATALGFHGSGRSNYPPMLSRISFAQAEERAIADAVRNAENRRSGVSTTVTGSGGVGFTSRAGMSISASPDAYPPPQAPVRVGGNIATPRKIADAQPVMPPLAQQANIQGVVILEIVIGADGAVSDAKILRSIPLLDQAAIDAVRQWRYEPTSLNGRPVPVIMTVTVQFR